MEALCAKPNDFLLYCAWRSIELNNKRHAVLCGAAADDPAPFEEELRQREMALGPDHPDVAESCSNLAILYNQKGDSGEYLVYLSGLQQSKSAKCLPGGTVCEELLAAHHTAQEHCAST
jgi:hypothetical protein